MFANIEKALSLLWILICQYILLQMDNMMQGKYNTK